MPGVVTAQQQGSSQAQALRPPASDTGDLNHRLQRLAPSISPAAKTDSARDYRIGAEDLLEIVVFEAPELNRTARVSAGGEISLPLLGRVRAAGLTPQELELVLQELLRRAYMRGPHVSVFVREVQSHAISVIGAVRRSGVFQIRGAKSLLEVLSMAEGLTDDAGDTVLILRGGNVSDESGALNPAVEASSRTSGKDKSSGPADQIAGPAHALQIPLKKLLESEDPAYNVTIHPGDVVKVTRAGVVYVVGEVRKPGGFVLRASERITVLQALALAEGLTRTASRGRARIVRTSDQSGARQEIDIDLGKVLSGKSADVFLEPKDILFVPGSIGRGALHRSVDAVVLVATGLAVYRR